MIIVLVLMMRVRSLTLCACIFPIWTYLEQHYNRVKKTVQNSIFDRRNEETTIKTTWSGLNRFFNPFTRWIDACVVCVCMYVCMYVCMNVWMCMCMTVSRWNWWETLLTTLQLQRRKEKSKRCAFLRIDVVHMYIYIYMCVCVCVLGLQSINRTFTASFSISGKKRKFCQCKYMRIMFFLMHNITIWQRGYIIVCMYP